MEPPMNKLVPAEPNVTPMIDVLLVLLIVFMVATAEVRRTMDTQLPEPPCSSCVVEEPPTPIILDVLPGPSYRVNLAAVGTGELFARLAAIYRARPQKIIFVAGHAKVPYEDVVTAMDVARSAGARVIAIAPR
jgi:biopolymer transport protein TolR